IPDESGKLCAAFLEAIPQTVQRGAFALDERASGDRGAPHLLREHETVQHRADAGRPLAESLGWWLKRYGLVQSLVVERHGGVDQAAGDPVVVLDHPVGQVHLLPPLLVAGNQDSAGRVEVDAVRSRETKLAAAGGTEGARSRSVRTAERAAERFERLVA